MLLNKTQIIHTFFLCPPKILLANILINLPSSTHLFTITHALGSEGILIC